MCIFFVGGQIRSRHRYGGGQNPYFYTNSQCYHYSFCPRGGQTPLPSSMGGHGRICPLDPSLTASTLIELNQSMQFLRNNSGVAYRGGEPPRAALTKGAAIRKRGRQKIEIGCFGTVHKVRHTRGGGGPRRCDS